MVNMIFLLFNCIWQEIGTEASCPVPVVFAAINEFHRAAWTARKVTVLTDGGGVEAVIPG